MEQYLNEKDFNVIGYGKYYNGRWVNGIEEFFSNHYTTSHSLFMTKFKNHIIQKYKFYTDYTSTQLDNIPKEDFINFLNYYKENEMWKEDKELRIIDQFNISDSGNVYINKNYQPYDILNVEYNDQDDDYFTIRTKVHYPDLRLVVDYCTCGEFEGRGNALYIEDLDITEKFNMMVDK